MMSVMSYEVSGREIRGVLIAAGTLVPEFWMLGEGEVTWVALSIFFGLLEVLERG